MGGGGHMESALTEDFLLLRLTVRRTDTGRLEVRAKAIDPILGAHLHLVGVDSGNLSAVSFFPNLSSFLRPISVCYEDRRD